VAANHLVKRTWTRSAGSKEGGCQRTPGFFRETAVGMGIERLLAKPTEPASPLALFLWSPWPVAIAGPVFWYVMIIRPPTLVSKHHYLQIFRQHTTADWRCPNNRRTRASSALHLLAELPLNGSSPPTRPQRGRVQAGDTESARSTGSKTAPLVPAANAAEFRLPGQRSVNANPNRIAAGPRCSFQIKNRRSSPPSATRAAPQRQSICLSAPWARKRDG